MIAARERFKQNLLLFARRRGYELAKLNESPQFSTLRLLIEKHGVQTIVDVGANEGQFGRGVRSTGYSADIVSLEPLDGPYGRLARESKDDPRWTCHHAALGVTAGTGEMSVAANLGMSSSFLPATELHDRYAPGAAVVGTELVDTMSWEQLSSLVQHDPCLLKLDVQGYEGHLLRQPAAQTFLSRVAVVVVEMSCVKLYEGAWSLGECFSFMEAQGYSTYAVFPEWQDRASHRLLQMNGVFERS